MKGKNEIHICIHEEDWNHYYPFKEKVLEFIGYKNATNGALKKADDTLNGRLERIEEKVDKLMFTMLASSLSAIVALIVAIVALLR